MLIVAPATIANTGALDAGSLPKRFFGRAMLVPRRAGMGLWLRFLVEIQVLRYLAALTPFVAVPLILRDTALPVSQAPALMLIVVGVVELRVLRLSKSARAAQVDPDTAARRLDTLTFRARALLRGIAARHGLTDGDLRLVVEQSELARIPPLTLVSVQTDTPRPRLLDLGPQDRAALAGLFDADLSEADLLAVNQREDLFVRDIAIPARAVSAHARLAAALDQGVAP